MASGAQYFADLKFTQTSLRSAASQVKSAMSKVTLPININVTKKSISSAHREIKAYFAAHKVYIDIEVSKRSLASAKRQLQSSLSAVSLPQITLRAGVSRTITNLTNSLNRLQTAGPVRAAAGAGGSGGGGRRGGASRGFGGGGFGGVNLPLGHLSGEASEFSRSMDAATARVFAFGATAVVLNSVTQSFSALVRSTIAVEEKLTDIKLIFGESEEVFSGFRDSIFQVAANTGQSFETVADGASELARQGLSAAETAERLNAALILTRTAGIDSAASVGALTAVINGFTSANLNANQIVNKVIAVDTAFAVSAKDLSDGFARAGSTAEDAGVSFDELLGLITALQQRTSRGGAVIGNGLKTIFTRISRGGVIEDLKELGVQIDANQSGIEKLQAIGAAFEAAEGDPSKQSRIKELAAGGFQINLISAALKDLNAEQSLFVDATNKSKQATNEAFERNAKQNETIKAQINGLVASVTNLSEKAGQITFAPVLKDLLENSKSVSDALSTSLNPDQGFNFAKGFFGGVGAFIQGPGALLVLGGILKIFGTVAGYAKQGLKEVLAINLVNREGIAIQGKINAALEKNAQINALISNQNLSINSRKRLALEAINREVLAEKNRLDTLKLVTAELQKQGAYLKANGAIGFDRSRGARFTRQAGEALRSPAAGLVGSIAGAGAVQSLRGLDQNAIKVTGINSQIERLRVSLSKLNEDTDSIKIKDLNQEIESLTASLSEAIEKSEVTQRSFDRLSMGVSASVLAFSTMEKATDALAFSAAAAALALKDFVIDPALGKLNDKFEQDRSNTQKEGFNVASEEDRQRRLEAANNRLAKSLELLSKEVTTSAQTFSSEFKIRSRGQSLFDESGFSGVESKVKLRSVLNELRPDSRDKTIEKKEVSGALIEIELNKSIEKYLESGNEIFKNLAQEKGFENISKIPTSISDAISGDLDALYQQMSNDLKNRLNPSSIFPFENTGQATPEDFASLAKDLEKVGSKTGSPIGKVMTEVAKKLEKVISGQDVLSSQKEFSDFAKELKFIPKTAAEIESLVSELEKFSKIGIGDDQTLESFSRVISSYAERARDILLEEAQLEKDGIEKRQKSAIELIDKEKQFKLDILKREEDIVLSEIAERKEENQNFLKDLRDIYGQTVDRQRDLRTRVSSGLTNKNLSDFTDPTARGALETIGINGVSQQGILGQDVSAARAGQLIGAEAGIKLKEILERFEETGQNPTFNQTDRNNIAKELGGLGLSDQFEKLAANPRERRALRPFLDAEEKFKSARSTSDIDSAIALQEQGIRNIPQISTGGPNTQKDAELTKFIIDAIQQRAAIEGYISSQGIGAEGSTGKRAFTESESAIARRLESERLLRERGFSAGESRITNDASSLSERTSSFFDKQIDDAIKTRMPSAEVFAEIINQQSSLGKIIETQTAPSLTTLGNSVEGLTKAYESERLRVDALQKSNTVFGNEESAKALEEYQKKITEFVLSFLGPGGLAVSLFSQGSDLFAKSLEIHSTRLTEAGEVIKAFKENVGITKPFPGLAKPE